MFQNKNYQERPVVIGKIRKPAPEKPTFVVSSTFCFSVHVFLLLESLAHLFGEHCVVSCHVDNMMCVDRLVSDARPMSSAGTTHTHTQRDLD